MTYRVSTEATVDWFSGKWVRYNYPEKNTETQTKILPYVKYNVLAGAFNVSTVLMVMAVSAAIFSTLPTAIFYGAIALFIRFTAERELNKLTAIPIPSEAEQGPGESPLLVRGVSFLYNSFTNQTETKDRVAALFQKLNGKAPEGWDMDKVVLWDYSVWKNFVELPS